MGKTPNGQVELVLENRQLVITFFVIVALCGVFFSLGYIVGHNTLSTSVRVTQAAAGSAESSNKPSPMPPAAVAPASTDAPPATDGNPEQAGQPADLNFYQSVEQKAPDSKLVPPEPPMGTAAAPPRAPAGEKPSVAQAAAPAPAPSPAPALAPAAVPSQSLSEPAGSGIMVQVSALTRREDANALVSLIREKKLPVQVTQTTSDTLFHVVVGPFKTIKEAEHAKSVLEEDGFRPIIKR